MKQTALHWAAKHGKYEICRLLVDHGADVNARDIGDKTPLYYALKAKRADIVKVFIFSNSHLINKKDVYGNKDWSISCDTYQIHYFRRRCGIFTII